ncbi:DUF4132 domain-containing protein [Anatilimnocola floriformis]|uniref:DUF4132 domain-containing protein n=1 Tax=Anatilimnocola floriformis TaxID=2948575 RepID=UPI0020C3995C|nr:DUF4132 domain-containing protein [Anatilimnocola floriformis]
MADWLARLKDQATNQQSYGAAETLKYVEQADLKTLQLLKPPPNPWLVNWIGHVLRLSPSPREADADVLRLVQAAAKMQAWSEIVLSWLRQPYREGEAPEQDFLAPLLTIIGDDQAERQQLVSALIAGSGDSLARDGGSTNSAGRFVLAAPNLGEVVANIPPRSRVADALAFIIRSDPARGVELAPHFLMRKWTNSPILDPAAVRILLEVDAEKYKPIILDAIAETSGNRGDVFETLTILAETFPQYLPRTRQEAGHILAYQNRIEHADKAARWLLAQYGVDGLPEICAYLRDCITIHFTAPILQLTVDALQEQARPAALAALEGKGFETRLAALKLLVVWNQPEDREAIALAVNKGLSEKEGTDVLKILKVVSDYDFSGMQEFVWETLAHKSKPVRSAAARALARLGEPAVERAIPLAAAKKSAVRSAAVTLLQTIESPAAIAALEARVDVETDEEVRDQILLALDTVWEKQGKKLTRDDVNERIERAESKLTEQVLEWLDDTKLPPLRFAQDQQQLTAQQVRYLLYRQSRAKEMRPDVEAKPLYALIDRSSSGDFAVSLLAHFFGSKMDAEDRWLLAAAALLGDDRIVAPLMQQIRKWVDANRGKLAEYAAQALALQAGDVALCAVDALSIRYRSKQKNIGKAASEAFADTAERLGMTPDELGDRVVPWLGFEPGQPRLIEAGDKKIEVRVGLDHKLEFRDLVKGKKVASLPSGVPAETKAEFKDLNATIREVIKGQLARIENLMVRQFRWPIARWQELYLQHPLLFPFATQMIWAIYDEGNKLVKPFRALEDRTLTDETDTAVALPQQGQIGLVHPLELTPAARQAWATHLADYNIATPILQIARPVISPAEEDHATKISRKYENTPLSAMTFRSRAERLGWQRGSVIDGGCISSYRKSFPGARADAILELDGMGISMGLEDSIKLGKFYFVRSGSVEVGSYTYDEPHNEQDERLIAFGDVPPIVFSETMGDLGKIVGTKADGSEAGEEA